MSVTPDIGDPVTNGDTAVSVVYHIMDAEGSLWRSAPGLVTDCLRGDGTKTDGGAIDANGQFLRIPTLRHLLPGTVAQIEVYIQRDHIDLQLFQVLDNDPTVDYIWLQPQVVVGGVMTSLDATLTAAGPGELEYTTGGALANDPPPQFSCSTIWRNRAIGCRGNSIYPSQEFANGLGIQWSYTMRFEWSEGTGDITAICPIDWNYCAIFKQDAIGIFSGPGPDGLGHGNFIVQTLQTRMGVIHPKSVVNGADGCYFQDAATGRVAVLTPQLNPQECLLGWFNEDRASITGAMQVEQKRQVWFTTSAGEVIVIDYKHRNDLCPNGQVYVWTLPSYEQTLAGMAIVLGLPTILLSGGSLIRYLEGLPMDQLGSGDYASILQSFETGELQPGSLQGMFDVSRVVFLGEYLAPHKLRITTYPAFSTTGTATPDKTFTAGPEQVSTRPPNCQRVQSLRVKVEELVTTSGGVTVNGKGLKFVGIALEIQPRGRIQNIDLGRVI